MLPLGGVRMCPRPMASVQGYSRQVLGAMGAKRLEHVQVLKCSVTTQVAHCLQALFLLMKSFGPSLVFTGSADTNQNPDHGFYHTRTHHEQLVHTQG